MLASRNSETELNKNPLGNMCIGFEYGDANFGWLLKNVQSMWFTEFFMVFSA